MTTVISIREFAKIRGDTPALVLTDLHQTESDEVNWSSPAVANALTNCALALGNARAMGIPVAFVRRIAAAEDNGKPVRVPGWLPGFEPRRCDMVFDRHQPSCYANPEFVRMANGVDGSCVVAGLFGESACLATFIDGFHRGHRLTFLSDASASRTQNDINSSLMHEIITTLISHYGRIVSTQTWIRQTVRYMAAH